MLAKTKLSYNTRNNNEFSKIVTEVINIKIIVLLQILLLKDREVIAFAVQPAKI